MYTTHHTPHTTHLTPHTTPIFRLVTKWEEKKQEGSSVMSDFCKNEDIADPNSLKGWVNGKNLATENGVSLIDSYFSTKNSSLTVKNISTRIAVLDGNRTISQALKLYKDTTGAISKNLTTIWLTAWTFYLDKGYDLRDQNVVNELDLAGCNLTVVSARKYLLGIRKEENSAEQSD
jgi:hypothetical protein